MAFKMRGFPMQQTSALKKHEEGHETDRIISQEEFDAMDWKQRDEIFQHLTTSQKEAASKDAVAREEQAIALLMQARDLERERKKTTDPATKASLKEQILSLYQQARDLGEDLGD